MLPTTNLQKVVKDNEMTMTMNRNRFMSKLPDGWSDNVVSSYKGRIQNNMLSVSSDMERDDGDDDSNSVISQKTK